MTLSPAAEALFDALAHRASGNLVLVAERGQRATFVVHAGDVVGAQIGFGFQSLAQVLWREGKLTSQQLDALWSSGEGGEPDPESLSRLGMDLHGVEALRWRVQLRELVGKAQEVRFTPEVVSPGPVKLAGGGLLPLKRDCGEEKGERHQSSEGRHHGAGPDREGMSRAVRHQWVEECRHGRQSNS